MIPYAYMILAAAAILLIIITRSARMMYTVNVLHAILCLTLTLTITRSAEGLSDGIEFFFADYLTIFELIIAEVVFVFASIYAGGYVNKLLVSEELNPRSVKAFYAGLSLLFLFTEMAFLSNNLALFWIFAELTTVSSAFLVAILSAKENIDAALKYIFIASTAMLFSFIGLIFLFESQREATGVGSLAWTDLLAHAQVMNPSMLITAFVFTYVGFSAKSGIVPFHSWLPDAHSKAPSAVSAVLSAALLNVGIYGIIRMFSIIQKTPGVNTARLLLITAGVITITIAALNMLRQKNMKKLIAFSSIENMGFILFGIGIGTPVALFWTLFQIMGHSFTKAGLFLSAGILHRQYKSENPDLEDEIRDPLTIQPLASAGVIIGSVAIIGTPFFPIFFSKFFLLTEAAKISVFLPVLVLILFAIAAVAMVRFLCPVFTTGRSGDIVPYHASGGMKFSVVGLLCLILIIGVFFPESGMDLLSQAVKDLGMGGIN